MSNTKKARAKQLLSLLLAFVMVMGMLPAMSMTAEAGTEASIPITEVNLTIREPIGGEHPSFDVQSDNDKVKIQSVKWTKGGTGTGKVLGEDDVFEDGQIYSLRIEIYGYDTILYDNFSEDCTVTVNGVPTTLRQDTGYYVFRGYVAKDSLYAYLPDDIYWKIWGNVTASGETGYQQLKEYIEKETVTWAIRLDSDVKYTEDYRLGMTVKGKKYLDLNGHDIDIKYDEGWTDTLFTIPEGSELVIIDSKGGGSIRYNGYIFDGADYEAGHMAIRNVFAVSGKLTINGGRILGGGRSKKQWLVSAFKDGDDSVIGVPAMWFNGYVRNQVNGYGVIVKDGGELTVNGGDVTGRGYVELNMNGWNPWGGNMVQAAAIAIWSDAKVTLNDGYFKGYGGADVIQMRGYRNDVTVKGGTFVTHKVDKIRLPQYFDPEETGLHLTKRDNYTDGRYGSVGLKSEWMDPNAEVLVSGEEAETDEDGVVQVNERNDSTHIIGPKESIPSPTSYIRPLTGVTLTGSTASDSGNTYRGAWTIGTKGVLEAEFDENDYYWEQGILDKDCMGDTRQNSYMSWQIWDYFSNKLLATVVKKNGMTLNLNYLPDSNGDPISIAWEPGRIYSVVAYRVEEWDGYSYEYQTLHKIGQYDIQAMSGNVGALGNADVVDIRQDGTITSNGNHYPNFVATVSQNTIDVLETMKDEGEITDWYVNVSYEEVVGDVHYPATWKLTSDNTSTRIYTGAPGITTVESKVYVVYASGASTVAHSQKADLVAFSDIAPADNFTWDSVSIPMITLTNYENLDAYIRLDAGFDRMVSLDRNVYGGEILTGQTLDASKIYWEYQDYDGSWIKIEPPKAGMVYGSERGETNNYLYVRAYGTYRACYPIGDKVYTSPLPMVVRSEVEYDGYPVKLTASTTSTTYGAGATITVDTTPVPGQECLWSDNLVYSFKLVSKPEGARTISNWYDNVADPETYFSNGGKTLNVDAFFAERPKWVKPGAYTYRVTVVDKDTERYTEQGTLYYQVNRTSFDVTIIYEYTAEDADIYIGGENISNRTDEGCYLMPGNTKEITMEARLYPDYTTQMPSGNRNFSVDWKITDGADVGEINDRGNAADFIAKKPGKATVLAKIKDCGNDAVFTEVKFSIIVPIAGFTVKKPELVVDQYVSAHLPEITSVWSYGGEKITRNVGDYLKAVHYRGSSGKVKINTGYDATYQFIPQGDNRFPVVKIEDELYGTIYEPDMSAISMNTFDTNEVSSDAGRGYSKGDTIVYVPEEVSVYYDYTYDWVRDPNAKYVDFISVTQTSPAVGDTAVYDPGTDWNTIKFLAGEVSFGAAPFDYSSAVYPVTELLGTGIPYDDASANYAQSTKTTDVLWNANATSYEWYGSSGGTEQSYSAGIHMNELNVYTADGTDGTTYYFSPDVMLVVNGHQVKVNVNTGTRIGSYYYFDVGTVDVYDGVTVLGIKAPVGGDTPATADQTVCLNSAATEALPLYVSRLSWFIDANGDNVCDEGEEALVWYDAEGNYDAEASGLNEDGTFKYNTTYKVSLSVALDEGAAGRLAPYTFKTSVYTGTVYQDAIMHYDTSGAPTDAVYAYPKTASEPLTKYEATFAAKAGDNGLTFPLDPAPSNAANHFALSSFGFKDAETGSYVGTNLLEDGKSYIFEVTFKAEDGYVFPEDFAVIINGETLTSGVTISGSDNYLSITYPFTLGGGAGEEGPTREELIKAFVTRMYNQCLSREPDEAGLAGWVEQLMTGQMNGAQIAEAFVFSNEMLTKNLPDEEFIKVLYRAMMGREADATGLAGWMNELTNDYSTRSEVTKAFVESAEFTAICESYGIIRGDYQAVGSIERFVAGFYTKCLGRPADQAGHWGWVKQLQGGFINGAQIAESFFFSEEFVGMNTSNEEYVRRLYRTILSREADEAGLAGWVEQLDNAVLDRRQILAQFIESNEFTELCAGYGIVRGSL